MKVKLLGAQAMLYTWLGFKTETVEGYILVP